MMVFSRERPASVLCSFPLHVADHRCDFFPAVLRRSLLLSSPLDSLCLFIRATSDLPCPFVVAKHQRTDWQRHKQVLLLQADLVNATRRVESEDRDRSFDEMSKTVSLLSLRSSKLAFEQIYFQGRGVRVDAGLIACSTSSSSSPFCLPQFGADRCRFSRCPSRITILPCRIPFPDPLAFRLASEDKAEPLSSWTDFLRFCPRVWR